MGALSNLPTKAEPVEISTIDVLTENLKLRGDVFRLRTALHGAEATFLSYAEQHAAKSPPAVEKSMANRQEAAKCRAVLSETEPRPREA